MPTFSWISAYEGIATALLDYEDHQDELCDIVNEVLGEPYDIMDPLTFFAVFNGKRRSFETRKEVVRVILDRLRVNATAPVEFHGIPVRNPLRWRYWDGGDDTIRHNWQVFRCALSYADGNHEARAEFTRLFDVVRAQGNVGDASLTMALYWARPKVFLPVDSNTRTYLLNRYDIGVPDSLSGEEYLALLDEVRKKSTDAYPTLSYRAWEIGGWVPAPSEYDPSIPADKWGELLRDSSMTSTTMLTALHCLAKHPKGATCAELDDDYGRGSSFYSSNVSAFGRRACERFGVSPCDVGGADGKWWPVVCVCNHARKSGHGAFEWRLRPELATAISGLGEGDLLLEDPAAGKRFSFNGKRLDRLVSLYKKDFPRFRVASNGGEDRESYKWDYARAYRDNWDIDAKGERFVECLRAALKLSATGQGSLLDNRHSHPFDRLYKLTEFDPEGIRDAFRVLYEPDRSLRDAYTGFVDGVEAVRREYDEVSERPFGDSHQTPSAVSLYLAFERPDRYHFFKPSVGMDFAECIDVRLPSGSVPKMLAYERLADAVLPKLLEDSELVELNDDALTKEQRAVDPDHHLMLQDIAHYASRYMKAWHSNWRGLLAGDGLSDGEGEEERMEEAYSKNMILYGPPGTGKTYQTRAYAVAICDGLQVENVLDSMADRDGYEEVLGRYNELVGEGRIGFVTFHQSYGYEDFIEGFRPECDEETGDVTYQLKKGAFREFCETAEDVVAVASVESGIPRFSDNPRPRVWKMGLKTGSVADLLEKCRAEGSLRMGWDEVSPDDVDGSTSLSEMNKRAINAFQEEMRQGDFVVIPGASSAQYDVAVVTSDFAWDEGATAAKRKRKAQWIGSIPKSDFLPINGGKVLTLQTVYELSRVSASRLLGAMGMGETSATTSKPAKPYVFIIDEINRGNVSKVFGELITLLEPSKRKGAAEETSVELPYSGDPFSVPSNVYVLGTMNTADRSIALMDTALRRRFEFVEVMPEPRLLEEIDIEGVNVARLLAVMNERIELLYDREHTLGHAYLMDLKGDPSIERLARVFETRLIPLLQEYFFDDYGKIRSVLGAAADEFIKESDGTNVFWGDDVAEYDRLRAYRVKRAPRDPGAYTLIYQTGQEG
ncbi:McrB family protein [Olsenella intestinalis]|uniref:McrB family protein n=1 Tax=Olsenella intestinalis TaxID=2930083 RepID=UPI00200E7495|nr:AAA family ATPase [Olsenella intestinalis]